MKLTVVLFYLFALANASSKENMDSSEEADSKPVHEAPTFSNLYTVKGVLYIPYAEVREPFYAWFDEEAGSSRIDYYGGEFMGLSEPWEPKRNQNREGMVKTYQLSKEGQYGKSLKLAPMTTETELNKETCFAVEGSSDNSITPQSILPDLTGFEHIGEDMVNGHRSDKWRLVTKKGDKVNKYTMWVRYKKSPAAPNVNMAIPLRYEMRGFNSLLGSHYDHYYLEYDWYSVQPIDPAVFKVDSSITCAGFPGPGDKHIYTFNPMREFIHNYDAHIDDAFSQFERTHSKEYPDHHEHSKRKDIFRQNLRYIHSKNRAGLGFQLGVNHLADKTELELKALRGRQYTPGSNNGLPFPHSPMEIVPESMDWRIQGAVAPVKDQSVCGSCWSFGTTGAIEGAYFLKYGHLVRLSQQALIDCSWGYGNNGCDGGEDFRSYDWMMKHGGLPTEDEYGPYLGQDGFCHVDNVTLTAKIHGYVNVTSGSADALKVAVFKHGPISVAIDASHKTFSFYSNGVYYDSECGNTPERLDHAVLVVGYGTLNNKPYWLVKNSWSNFWGNDGYVLMSQQDNNCGVTTDPTYVLM